MRGRISRRHFVRQSTGLGAGALLAKPTSLFGSNSTVRSGSQDVAPPFIATSHSNETGAAGVEAGWEILSGGGSALDAVERATNIIEEDEHGKIPFYDKRLLIEPDLRARFLTPGHEKVQELIGIDVIPVREILHLVDEGRFEHLENPPDPLNLPLVFLGYRYPLPASRSGLIYAAVIPIMRSSSFASRTIVSAKTCV